MKRILLIALCVMLPGCQTGYQKDRTLRVIHILGVGWFTAWRGTNQIRVLSIGALRAASVSSVAQTNAPFTMGATSEVEP